MNKITESKEMSNYDKVVETWRQKFLTMDQEMLIRKFHLEYSADTLFFSYFHHVFCIDRRDGRVSFRDEPGRIPNFNTTTLIYNMFHYAAPAPAASGNMVPFRNVRRVYPFEKNYRENILHRLETDFTGHVTELKSACERLGGTVMKQGDAGYRIPFLPFMNIDVYFWDADDEFPAQANILFDYNITDFMHEENVVSVAADLVYYLEEAAGFSAQNIYA